MRRNRATPMFVGLVAAFVIAVLGGSGSMQAGEYRDPTWHFSFEIPAGWQAMDPGRLAAINAIAEKIPDGQRLFYDAGFVPQRATDPSTFILLQVIPQNMSKLSYENLERELQKTVGAEVKQTGRAVEDDVTNIDLGEISVDREHNRYAQRMRSDLADGPGKLETLSIGHLGAKAAVSLHCYSRDANYAANLPVFQRVSDSFAFEKDCQFVPRTGFGFDFQAIGNGSIRSGIVGAIAGAAGAGIYFLMKRHNDRRRRIAGESFGPDEFA